MAAALADRLASIVGAAQVLADPADRWPYGYDNSRRQALPDLVVFAAAAEQVRDIIRVCHELRTPLVARGRGSGTTGAAVPVQGGVVLSLERMDHIHPVVGADRYVEVEPGATNEAVQRAAAAHGLFWAPDPTSSAYCSVGGNLAHNSAGPRAVKYGTPRENTLGLHAVTGSGQTLRTGVHTTKGVVGYDLTRLLIGSEGTLAVFTRARLKLTPLPEGKRALRIAYRDVHGAAAGVARIMTQAVTPSALEFIDAAGLSLVRNAPGVDLPPAAGSLLLVEVDGPLDCLDAAERAIERAARGAGLVEFAAASGADDEDALWAARKALSPALRSLAPKKINEDVVVPVSRLPELVAGLDGLAKRHGILIVNFGHAGNGNLHTNLLVDPSDPAQMLRAEACLHEVFALVLRLQGTLSGEHGVGLAKREFVGQELDPAALALMRSLKALFDPHGILNPGKLFPPEDEPPA